MVNRGHQLRPEVMGAVEQALEKAKTKFDHIEDTEKTTNAFFKKTVTCTMQTSQTL